MHEECAEDHFNTTVTSPDKMKHFDDSDESSLHISFIKHRILQAKTALDAQSVLKMMKDHENASERDIFVTLPVHHDDVCRISPGSLVYLTPDVMWLWHYSETCREGRGTDNILFNGKYRRPLVGIVLLNYIERGLVFVKLSRSRMSPEWSNFISNLTLLDGTEVVKQSWHVELAVTESLSMVDFIPWYMEHPNTIKQKMPSYMKVIAGMTHMVASELIESRRGAFLHRTLLTDKSKKISIIEECPLAYVRICSSIGFSYTHACTHIILALQQVREDRCTERICVETDVVYETISRT